MEYFMKCKFAVFGLLVMALSLSFVFIGCDTGNENNDPTPPSADYLNAKTWESSIGPMPSGITSITITFSGTNVWTETFIGTGNDNGKTVVGTYTLSGLTIALTVTSSTVTDGPVPGTNFTSVFDATQATKLTTPQGHVFNRQP
jgi:hypothetical protein